ncbi:BTAD domain-containing putative transcriptional regulator [Chloroflexota bacterium]
MVTNSFETFSQYATDTQIILLHPRGRYRSVLIARLLNDPDIQTLYYAMGPDDINLPAFLTGLAHDLTSQHPSFGHNLNLVEEHTAEGTMQHWLDALAADLNEWTDQPFLLVLDEYDRSDSADDIQRFIEALVPLLPSHCRVIINSRTLPRLPWVSLIACNQAIILEDEHLITGDFYDHRQQENGPRLDVTALGPGYVSLNDGLITTWEGHLPRLLFFFVLDRPTVTRSEICQAFWPNLEIEQAVNVFHVTKRRLHKALGKDVLVHEHGYYRVNPELVVYYDVIDFVGELVNGRATTAADKIEHWQRAIDLYRGPFLQGHNDQWIQNRRASFLTGYMEAVTGMANIRYEKGSTEHALRLYLRALNEDETREDIHQKVMQLYAEMGRRSEAAAHYQKMQREFSARRQTVSEETESIYQQIMS